MLALLWLLVKWFVIAAVFATSILVHLAGLDSTPRPERIARVWRGALIAAGICAAAAWFLTGTVTADNLPLPY